MQVVCVHAIVDPLPLLPQFLEYAAIQHRVQGRGERTASQPAYPRKSKPPSSPVPLSIPLTAPCVSPRS